VAVGQGQGQGGAAPKQNLPHKIGLIDMSHIFRNYEKLTVLREDLKTEYQQKDEQARAMATEMQQLEAKMQQLQSGSDDFVQIESQILKLKSDFDAFRQRAQREPGQVAGEAAGNGAVRRWQVRSCGTECQQSRSGERVRDVGEGTRLCCGTAVPAHFTVVLPCVTSS
jgi:hypothetical protein